MLLSVYQTEGDRPKVSRYGLCCTVLRFLAHRSRSASSQTYTMVSRMIVYIINTGLLTSFDAIGSLVSYAASPDAFIYICFFFALGRLYSNSLLATLNVRRSLAGQSSHSFESSSISLQGINGVSSGMSAVNVVSNGKVRCFSTFFLAMTNGPMSVIEQFSY